MDRVRRLRAELLNHSAREQQLVGGQTRVTPALPLLIIAILWTLICGVYFVIFNDGFNAPPPIRFFLSDAPAGSDALGYDARRGLWWIVYVNVTGIMLSALFAAWSGLVAGRVVVRSLQPLPPVRDDEPPRCRLCGADLPAAGRIRRCDYCGSDHLLTGRVFRERAATLEQSLGELEAELGKTVKARQDALEAAAYGPLLLPVPIVFIGSGAAFLPAAPAAIWAIPVLLAVAVLVLRVRTLMLPKVIYEAGAYRPLPGDDVRIGEARLRAFGELELLGTGPAPSLRFLLVGQNEPEWGLLLDWVSERPARALRFRVAAAMALETAVEQARMHQAPTTKGKRRPVLAASVRRDTTRPVPFQQQGATASVAGTVTASVSEASAPIPREFSLCDPESLPEGAVALAALARGRRGKG